MVQIPLTPTDIAYLKHRLAVKDYVGGYHYLYGLTQKAIANQSDGEVRDQMLMTANWLVAAKAINGMDGGFVSEDVFYSMKYAVERSGRRFTRHMYKTASNELAYTVIMDFIDAKGILPIQEVINRDVQAAVKGLGLQPWQWGGTLGDVFPIWMGGLGQDFVEVPGENFLETMENWATVIVQNVAALGMIFEKNFGNASMVLIIAAKKIFEYILFDEVEINLSLPEVSGTGSGTEAIGVSGSGSGSGSGSSGGGGSGGGGWSHFCIERLQHRRRDTCDKWPKA